MGGQGSKGQRDSRKFLELKGTVENFSIIGRIPPEAENFGDLLPKNPLEMHWFESKNTKTCLRKHENKAFLKYYELKSSQNFPPPAESGREMFFFGDFSNMGENLSL